METYFSVKPYNHFQPSFGSMWPLTFGGCESDWMQMTHGLPQGSLLGPFMFSLRLLPLGQILQILLLVIPVTLMTHRFVLHFPQITCVQSSPCVTLSMFSFRWTKICCKEVQIKPTWLISEIKSSSSEDLQSLKIWVCWEIQQWPKQLYISS